MIKLWGGFGYRLICWLFFGTWKTRTEPAWRLFGGHSKQKIVIILLTQKAARTRSIRNCIPANPCHSKTPPQSFFRFVCCLSSYSPPWVKSVGHDLIRLPWLMLLWDWKQAFPGFFHFYRWIINSKVNFAWVFQWWISQEGTCSLRRCFPWFYWGLPVPFVASLQL